MIPLVFSVALEARMSLVKIGIPVAAGLITDRRAGLWVYYSLRPVADPLASAHLAVLRSSLAMRPPCRSPTPRSTR